jgi:hypothetical protein
LRCRNCGEVVDPRRVELGYDYCLKAECQARCVRRVELAAVGVNKAADYYQRADEVLPPRPPATAPGDADDNAADADDSDVAAGASVKPRPASPTRPRAQTTLDRLRREEAALDAALAGSFERFSRGEITARELDQERDRLIETFNRRVMSENIRYRSMLRRRTHRTR